MENHFKGFMV
jgi:hypothetical protein